MWIDLDILWLWRLMDVNVPHDQVEEDCFPIKDMFDLSIALGFIPDHLRSSLSVAALSFILRDPSGKEYAHRRSKSNAHHPPLPLPRLPQPLNLPKTLSLARRPSAS